MIVTPIKTARILPSEQTIFEILDRSLTMIDDGSIIAITSKIVSLCEGSKRVIPENEADKDKLIHQEADYYLPKNQSKYGVQFTITRDTLIPNAGVDESNTNGNLVLWPSDPQKTTNEIRDYIKNKFNLSKVGVIITDSTCSPLRWGTHGICLTHSGFRAVNDYIGKSDIFGRKMQYSMSNVSEGLASSAVMIMGEGNEQTPIVVISKVPFVDFQDRNPTQEEINNLVINSEDDLFAPFLNSVSWHKGKNGQ